MIEFKKTLYSINHKKDILIWIIEVINYSFWAKIRIKYGQLYGSLITTNYNIKEGKNIGKSNETDYLTQAILDAESRVRKQIRKGYKENIEQLTSNRQDNEGDNKPMLAQKFKPDKFKYPALIQPKLNGVRVMVRFKYVDEGLFGKTLRCIIKSREGVEYTGVKHLNDILISLVTKNNINPDDIILDGELYCHKMYLQDIRSACVKENIDSNKIQLWLFDIASDNSQHERIKILQDIYKVFSYSHKNNIVLTPTHEIYSDDMALIAAEEYIKIGYEGAMLRDKDATYQYGKRSRYLVKIKKVKYDTFKIIDVIPTDKDMYAGKPIALFVCKNDINDLTFVVTPAKSKADRSIILDHKEEYIGKYITVSYFERTKDGIPFHANGI